MLDFDLLEQITIIRQTLAPLQLSRWQLFKLMIASILRSTSTLVLVLSAITALIPVLLVWRLWTGNSELDRLGIPRVGGSKQHRKDFRRLVEEGHHRYPNSPYVIRTQGLQYVVFPPESFDEIKKLPPHIASAQDFFVKTYFGHYTTAGTETPALLKAISIDLARSIPFTVVSRQEDAKAAADDVLGSCPEWKEVKLFPAVTRMIAMTNACTLVGRHLARSDGWVKLVSKFPFEVMAGTFVISGFPRLIQPILAPLIFLPAIITKWRMKWSLRGVIKRDMHEFLTTSDKKTVLKLKENGKVPFTASLMTRYKPEEATLDQLLQDYVTVSFESTPSSTAALYLILMELATRPQLVEILRQELREVLVDGKLPKTHLAELRKMDSVMRESARANPFSLLGLYRLLRVPTKLSTGPVLPAGTLICVDVHHIHGSEELWTKPEEFHGLRYYDNRKEPGKENKYQFVSTGADSPGWGDGAMACPGRLFANSTIKIALAHLIMHYDFKFRDGEGKPLKTSLPNGSWNPGLDVKLMFKSRKWDA
ncbi:cytochrome P450 oxidoreductase GliF [Aspergillus sclerotioniger CBS 115572]|uniref:Cytochrome P450 oxidoreductase GliF n=1 Tax=Aspergillus sclerotioniger CBS 115572 TaxID=1450535 RepID=A0A317VNY7_9EURO|nr:cytochrome P450 oxidoreductase GliF [Aspergillus sclerotioniger CBS 115572]PWY76063.1 cytochrome P450 oxidoreductase GliF [Aspergillus sclerotioniger CBS 115572]